ncbi:MAG: hypothetical protein MUF23_04660 [Pirellula sp.]|jgi:hypothetical protein|nr:hypothetical protein [Pirellula sp.]
MSFGSNASNARSETPPSWSRWTQAGVSIALVAHFSLLALNYASNNSLRRSEFADQALIAVQPYLITLGWYTELAPISWVTGESFDHAMTIEYKSNRSDTRWTTWVDSKRSDGRWRRLVALAGALAEHDDSDGLGLIAHALVTRAAKEGIAIDQIRFSMELPEVSDQPESIYEAAVVKLDATDITLIPRIEETRSVPVIPEARAIPAAKGTGS